MLDPKKKRYLYIMFSGFGAISLSVLLFFFIYRLQGIGDALDRLGQILAPFVYGGVVAYLLRPMCNLYERTLQKLLGEKRKKAAEPLAVGLSLITGLLIIYALIIMILPQLVESITNFWNNLPDKVDDAIAWLNLRYGENEQFFAYLETAYETVYNELDTWVRQTVVPGFTNIVSGVGMSVWKLLIFLKDLLIGIIVSAYLLSSRKKYKAQSVMIVRSIFTPRWAEMILEEAAYVDRMFGGFIDGKIVDSAIIGVLCYLGCLIFRFPSPLLVAAIVGITNVIPFFGPFIGAIPSVLLILLESPVKAMWFIPFIFGLQQLDGNIIGPRILGDRTGLSSFWVLFSIILFGGLWGLVGMVICVPLFAVIYDVIKRLIRKGLEKRGCLEVWHKYKADYPDEKATSRRKAKKS